MNEQLIRQIEALTGEITAMRMQHADEKKRITDRLDILGLREEPFQQQKAAITAQKKKAKKAAKLSGLLGRRTGQPTGLRMVADTTNHLTNLCTAYTPAAAEADGITRQRADRRVTIQPLIL